MHILIAPNSFKHALSASKVADCIREGLDLSQLTCTTTCFPVGDGGDGTGALLIEKAHGSRIRGRVTDPLGKWVTADFGLTEAGTTAILELADVSGLQLLQGRQLNPLQANTRGAGELMKLALDHQVTRIVLCIGGSATIDGATGLLQALGIRFLDILGNELPHLPENLTELASIDFSRLDQRIRSTKIIVLCDVENTLLGKEGAASVFGPQKGASESDIEILEAGLARLKGVALQQLGKDMSSLRYGGAAGGVAAGLAVFLNARLVNGIEYFLDQTNFEDALHDTDLVITGEGSIDLQTLQGKAPFGVARLAKKKGIPVIGLAGQVPIFPQSRLKEYFDILIAIGNQPVELATAINDTPLNLVRTAKLVGDLLALRTA